MPEAWIIDAVRTPRGLGKVGKGALADQHPQIIGAAVLRALAERNGPRHLRRGRHHLGERAARSATQGGDLGRMAALDAGYDIHSSGSTLDRYCGLRESPPSTWPRDRCMSGLRGTA